MRWQQLFDDLQSQFEAEQAATEHAEAASQARAEVGAVRLAERLGGALGFPLVLGVGAAGQVTGTLVGVGPDWLLLTDEQGRELLVALPAVRTVSGLGRRTAAPGPAGAVRPRLDLRRALRGLARDRSALQLVLDDGTTLTGTVDRVGADYVELAEHPVDEPRRQGSVRGVRAVVIGAVAVVRRSAPGLD
ncbi:hypothetical protein [Blastococcus tunisiensis]|uniref:Uncharacterized protein n=1 Tax=Blastococcus tunisiensis TaxID=1798228 RepID=A0A1I1WQZ3_9ACTN|nr:hypothetical protein [Blastococcus sp. DSM 46838]SFD96798.1 hypothetical protein SAMN05216574_101471 [Blastococcus sp. DSM 46838]